MLYFFSNILMKKQIAKSISSHLPTQICTLVKILMKRRTAACVRVYAFTAFICRRHIDLKNKNQPLRFKNGVQKSAWGGGEKPKRGGNERRKKRRHSLAKKRRDGEPGNHYL